MSVQLFLSCVERVSQRSLSLGELLTSAEAIGVASPDLAVQLYRLWLATTGDDPLAFAAHFNVSVTLDRLGHLDEAEASLRAALALNPAMAAASVNLGGILERQRNVAGAVKTWQDAAELLSTITGDNIQYRVTLLKQISRVLLDAQDHNAAEQLLTQCLDITPDARDISEQFCASRLAQCKWPVMTTAGRATPSMLITKLHPLSLCAYSDDPLLQLGSADSYVRMMAPPEQRTLAFDRRHAAIPEGRALRIGYVSSDLRRHAVGFLMAEVFELHDKDAFHITAYYCGPTPEDEHSLRFKNHAHQWRDIRAMSDAAIAAQIAADEIDILIDVNGHTREARLGAFAARPAPIIVNWLGFPGTMGSPFHNYIIADDMIIPPAMETFYSEAVLRLPCYQPNDRQRVIAVERPTREQAGLPETGFVFCSFNAAHKITRFSFERWLEILSRVDGSCLWLLDYGASTNERLRAYASERGIAAERLIFAPKIANPHHMARIALADLVLDTSPYGAHTTASDALWMGVPVITTPGRCFASRVCASLVRAAGLPELVCTSPEAFIEQAVALATAQRDQLDAYTQRLRTTRDTCLLFDTPRLVRSLEGLYRTMAATHRAGQTPVPNIANLAAYLAIGAKLDHEGRELGFASDYLDQYHTALAHRHAIEPMAPDARLWSGALVKADNADQDGDRARQAA